MFHQNLTDEQNLACLPVGHIQEIMERAVSCICGGKLVRIYALKHGEQLYIPHCGKVIPEMVVAERVAYAVSKIPFVHFVLVNDAEVIEHAGYDFIYKYIPRRGIERGMYRKQHIFLVVEVMERMYIGTEQQCSNILHPITYCIFEFHCIQGECVLFVKCPSNIRQYEIQHKCYLGVCQLDSSRFARPLPDIVEFRIAVEKAVQDLPGSLWQIAVFLRRGCEHAKIQWDTQAVHERVVCHCRTNDRLRKFAIFHVGDDVSVQQPYQLDVCEF